MRSGGISLRSKPFTPARPSAPSGSFSPHSPSDNALPSFVASPPSLCYGFSVVKFPSSLRGKTIFLFAAFLVADLGSILEQTGWVARGVLALLLIFSIVSWAIIFQKLGFFGRVKREGDQFLRIFRATHGVVNPQALANAGSPFATVYAFGYRELQSQVGGAIPGTKLKSLQAVTANMQLAAAEEVRRAEKGMSWLATTGSVSPFMLRRCRR